MSWPEFTVRSVAEIVDWAIKLMPQTLYPGQLTYAFRGQSNAEWLLEPTLIRGMPKNVASEDMLRIEDMAFRSFLSQAHLHIVAYDLPPAHKSQIMHWWALMRHHHAPTRLLDWTASLYVAAYFAVSDHLDHDGVIWFAHMKILTDRKSRVSELLGEDDDPWEYYRHPNHPSVVGILHPPKRTARMVAQQGLFSVSRQILDEHSSVIDRMMETPGESERHLYGRILVPNALKRQLRRHLVSMNLTASSLFPGVDGLGKSIAELVELYETRPPPSP